MDLLADFLVLFVVIYYNLLLFIVLQRLAFEILGGSFRGRIEIELSLLWLVLLDRGHLISRLAFFMTLRGGRLAVLDLFTLVSRVLSPLRGLDAGLIE